MPCGPSSVWTGRPGGSSPTGCSALGQRDLGRSLVTSRPVAQEVGYYLLGTLQLGCRRPGARGGARRRRSASLAARRPGGAVDRLATAGSRACAPCRRSCSGCCSSLVVLGPPRAGCPRSATASASDRAARADPGHRAVRAVRPRHPRHGRGDAALRATSGSRAPRDCGAPGRPGPPRAAQRGRRCSCPTSGVQAVILIEGVVVVESLFAWQGLGHALVHAVFWRDVPVLQAAALVLALLVVGINTVVDLVGAVARSPSARQGGGVMTTALHRRRSSGPTAYAAVNPAACSRPRPRCCSPCSRSIGPLRAAPTRPRRTSAATSRRRLAEPLGPTSTAAACSPGSRTRPGSRCCSAPAASPRRSSSAPPAGILAAWRGGWVDAVLRAVSEAFVAIPALLVVLLVAALAAGGQLLTLYLGLALAQWVEYFRVVRARAAAWSSVALRSRLPGCCSSVGCTSCAVTCGRRSARCSSPSPRWAW